MWPTAVGLGAMTIFLALRPGRSCPVLAFAPRQKRDLGFQESQQESQEFGMTPRGILGVRERHAILVPRGYGAESVCMCACAHVWACRSVCVSVFASVHARAPINPSIHRPSFDPSFIHTSIHPSIRHSIRPSIHPSIHPSIRPSVRLSVCLPACLYMSRRSACPTAARVAAAGDKLLTNTSCAAN